MNAAARRRSSEERTRERVRPVGHEPPDLAEVARRREPPGDDHEHAVGEPLDLLEDVGARTGSSGPRAAIGRSRSIMCSRWRGSMPLNGSSSSRIGGSWTRAAGDLRPLSHALRIGRRSARSAASVRSTVRDARAAAAVGIGKPLETRGERDELAAGQEADGPPRARARDRGRGRRLGLRQARPTGDQDPAR